MSFYIVKIRNIRYNNELRNVLDLTIFESENVRECAFTERLHYCAIQLHNNNDVLYNYLVRTLLLCIEIMIFSFSINCIRREVFKNELRKVLNLGGVTKANTAVYPILGPDV